MPICGTRSTPFAFMSNSMPRETDANATCFIMPRAQGCECGESDCWIKVRVCGSKRFVYNVHPVLVAQHVRRMSNIQRIASARKIHVWTMVHVSRMSIYILAECVAPATISQRPKQGRQTLNCAIVKCKAFSFWRPLSVQKSPNSKQKRKICNRERSY